MSSRRRDVSASGLMELFLQCTGMAHVELAPYLGDARPVPVSTGHHRIVAVLCPVACFLQRDE